MIPAPTVVFGVSDVRAIGAEINRRPRCTARHKAGQGGRIWEGPNTGWWPVHVDTVILYELRGQRVRKQCINCGHVWDEFME